MAKAWARPLPTPSVGSVPPYTGNERNFPDCQAREPLLSLQGAQKPELSISHPNDPSDTVQQSPGLRRHPLPLPWTPAGLTGSGRVESVHHAPRQQPGLLSDLFDLVACLCFALRILRSLQHSQRGSKGSCPRGHSRPHARPPLARGDPC